MATAIPQFEPFDIHADGAIAQRWRKWIKRLENLFVAAAISDKKRQRALLLYYAGEEVYEIFDTLPDTGDDFETAKTKLNAYFDPKKNVEFEIFTFRQAKQNPGETMNSYHSRLRQLATTCEFTDVDKEVKSQIIQSCTSQRLRGKASRDSTMTLEALLAEARALEVSEQQATDIESPGTVNAVEEAGRTTLKLGALLGIGSAIPARNMAIMRSIVEVPKTVSLVGEAEHAGKEIRSKDIDVPSPRKPLTK